MKNPRERPEIKALLVGIGEHDNEELLALVVAANRYYNLLEDEFRDRKVMTNPMVVALGLLLIDGCQRRTHFTRAAFLDWSGKLWDAMEQTQKPDPKDLS